MLMCPDCRSPLEELRCSTCDHQFESRSGFPLLLSRNLKYRQAAEYGEAYDAIYNDRTNVWEEQGRTPEFLEYFSSLLKSHANGKYLEIGCGEGFLLEKVDAVEKHGVDLSTKALSAARAKTGANLSVSLAERLPYASETFDLVAAVGVMEHFIDAREAFVEIRRVLKSGGYFINLVHVDLTTWDRISGKVTEYWLPRPRPIAFARWLKSYLLPDEEQDQLPKQPIQNHYTTRTGRAALVDSGFRVSETLSTRSNAKLPLSAPDVVIYVACK